MPPIITIEDTIPIRLKVRLQCPLYSMIFSKKPNTPSIINAKKAISKLPATVIVVLFVVIPR